MSEKLLNTARSKQDLVAKAYLLLNERRYDNALKIFQDLLGMDPDDPEVLTGMAATYMRKDQTNKAIDLAEKALSVDPSFYYTYDVLAEIYFIKKNNPFKAEEYARKSLELNPYDSSTYSLLAQIYYFQKQFDECFAYATEALHIDPENYIAHMSLGLYYAHIPDLEKVEEHFKVCLSIAPNSSMVYGHFGMLNMAFTKNDIGYKLLREAVRLNPEDRFLQENFREAFIRNNPFYAPLYWLTEGKFDDVYLVYASIITMMIAGFVLQAPFWPHLVKILLALLFFAGLFGMVVLVIYRFIMRFFINRFYDRAIKNGRLVEYI